MRVWILAAGLGLVLATGPAAVCAQFEGSADEQLVLNSEAFLQAHPDLNYRRHGMVAYDAGRYERALTRFRRAARYADKPSQAMIGEMLWKGEGVARDPALAYAWMDLAAERGYAGFTVLRERYWARMDEAQRQDAVRRGAAVYAEFGDEVAKPRIAAVLRRESRRTTGSRTGFTGQLKVYIPGPGGLPQAIDGSQFYDPRFWDPEQYQAWHDSIWTNPRTARVTVGDLEDADSERVMSSVPDAADEGEAPEPELPPDGER